MLTSAHMKMNAAQYEPFLGVPVDQYCASHIEPVKIEIEQFGIQALTDVLIAPAGMVIEISYLDRSPGEQVNVHQFGPTYESYANPPTLRLLFKP